MKKNKSKDLIFNSLVSKIFDWLTKSSFDTPISNFFKGLILFAFFIAFVHIALFVVSIPALIIWLVLFKGTEAIFELFPKSITNNDFLSMEAGLISFLLTAYAIFILTTLCIVIWDMIKKKQFNFNFFELSKDVFQSIYYLGYSFILLNIAFISFVSVVLLIFGFIL
jgi:hypothetical protein